jgi:hypothetical protein
MLQNCWPGNPIREVTQKALPMASGIFITHRPKMGFYIKARGQEKRLVDFAPQRWTPQIKPQIHTEGGSGPSQAAGWPLKLQRCWERSKMLFAFSLFFFFFFF